MHPNGVAGGAAAGVGGLICIGIPILIGIAATVLWIWALVDCLTKEPSTGNEKIIWLLVIFFLHLLGAILYMVIRRPQRIREHGR